MLLLSWSKRRQQRMKISIRSFHISRMNESYLVDTSELET